MAKIEVTVVVFDQGNTLLMDPFPSVIELQKGRFDEVCQHHGVAVSTSQIAEEWIKSNKGVHYPYVGHFYQEEPIVQRALRRLGVQEDIAAILALELLREYRVGLKKVISSDSRNLEVRSTLQQLRARGKRLGVFSNDRTVGLGLVLSTMRVKSFFQYIETSESLGAEKPDPRVFEHILAHFQVPPHVVAYVGDDPVTDIEGAKKHGFKAIQYMVNSDAYNEY